MSALSGFTGVGEQDVGPAATAASITSNAARGKMTRHLSPPSSSVMYDGSRVEAATAISFLMTCLLEREL
jgi:hypothetical protein